MQQQAPQSMNPPSSTPLNLVTTEQIQKYLDDNKNLIMAILEFQKDGKIAECAQFQAVLQKNLMYLAAIADAQPQGSQMQTQVPTGSAAQQVNPHPQAQAPTMQHQTGVPAAKLPFQLNAVRPQNQQNHLLHLQQQQQLQAQFSLGGVANNGLHMLMQPGIGGSGNLMDLRGSQSSAVEPGSGDFQGNSGLRSGERRE